MYYLFCYEKTRDYLAEICNRYTVNKTRISDVKEAKKILSLAYKLGYIKENPSLLDLRKKENRQRVMFLAIYFSGFNNLKLITKRTIKERGWTDKLIEKYLWVDVVTKNPYYKSAAPMKLYCQNRVEFVEENEQLKDVLVKNLKRRFIRNTKYQNKLAIAPYKWVATVGDFDIALLLIVKILQGSCVHRNSRFPISEKKRLEQFTYEVILRLNYQNYLVGSQTLKTVHYFPQNFYWFEIKGYRNFLVSKYRISKTVDFTEKDIELDIEYNTELDLKLLFNNSGWSSTKEVVNGLIFLLKNAKEFNLNSPNTKFINRFFLAPHLDPVTEDDIFAFKTKISFEHDLISLRAKVLELRKYQEKGCPHKFNCKLMGAVNQYRCVNFVDCKNLDS